MVQEKPVAVILAAGMGTRMGGGVAKPLLPLFGIPIVEHTIRALLERGYRIVVVYHNPAIAEYIERNFPDIELIYNPHPERENGYSLYLASRKVKEDFLLVMSDHYYTEAFFEALPDSFDVSLAVLSRYCHDPDEATKVKVDGDRVVAISKDLSDYDLFDTGMFLCKEEIFECARELVERKEKIKLAEIFQLLADRGRLSYLEVDGKWIDIDAPWELELAERIVKESLIKNEDGIISRRFNRHISVEITKRLAAYRFITPNRLTVFSFCMGLVAALLFAAGHPFWGGLWAQLTSIVDGCDGELARLRHMRSRFGAVLDSTTDRYADAFIMLGILWGLPLSRFNLLGFFFAVTGVIIFSYVWHLTRIRVRVGGRDLRLFMVMVGGILGSLSQVFLSVTLWSVGLVAHLCASLSLYKLFVEENEKTQHYKSNARNGLY